MSLQLRRLSWQLKTSRGRRRNLLYAAVIVGFCLLYVVSTTQFYIYPRGFSIRGKLLSARPSYTKLYQWEDNLPQHNLELPFPEGRTGRYLKFSNQIQKLGWNNVFNEVLMNAHLAHESNRAYVFQDYIWKDDYYPWWIPPFTWKERSRWPHTPLNALISGPTSGSRGWEAGDPAPRSISERWFDVVCPEFERRIIVTREVKPSVQWESGDVVFERWASILRDAPERCIEIVPVLRSEDNFPQVFDLYLWGSDRILSLWDSFSKSPTSRLLETSPLVKSAVDRNSHIFLPRDNHTSISSIVHRNPFAKVLAMHVRRGDFKQACYDLARWNSTFYSWNLLPSLPDKFIPPPGGSWGENTPENTEFYMKRCLPSFDAIVRKAREAREDYVGAATGSPSRTLDVMYLLTNDDSEWLQQLKTALQEDGWGTIVTSRNLRLNTQQTDVSMAVDMDIARQAAVFVGNGWSSFTSNIVHRRLVDGKEPISIRFW